MNENIKAERENALLFIKIAEELFAQKSVKEAINYCSMALSQFPDLKEAKILLYKIYSTMKNEPKKQEMFEILQKEFPNDQDVKAILDDNDKNNTIMEKDVQTNIGNIVSEKETENKENIVFGNSNVIEENTTIKEQESTGEDILSADETEQLLDKALNEINMIKGVLGSIIIEEYGIIIKEKTDKGLDADTAAALFSVIFGVSNDAFSKIDLGDIERIFIEMGKIRIYLFKGSGYILGIFTEEIVKIGLIHVKAKQLLKNIKKVLGV